MLLIKQSSITLQLNIEFSRYTTEAFYGYANFTFYMIHKLSISSFEVKFTLMSREINMNLNSRDI